MTRTARRASVVTLAVLAAVAAIIAVDLAPPAQAQSDDETTGRIVARRLDDGRVEFAWQPTGGARVLPTQRYFPTDATVDRWLRSSPVEVGGAELGRINARRLSDGRVEFAFTPTDRERITPRARYFPADARVGRWLRSTEIAIGPARAGYSAVSAGAWHTCGLRTSGKIACWGLNGIPYYDPEADEARILETGQTDAPPGNFRAVAAGWTHTCAIRENEEIACWGNNDNGQTDAPAGSFTAVSASFYYTCAIRENGEIACWGRNHNGQTDTPEGSYTAVSAGSSGIRGHACAIRESGEIACWGSNTVTVETEAGSGRYVHFEGGQIFPPPGSFTAVSADGYHACAIRDTGKIACWGWNFYGQIDAPDDAFTAVSAGGGGHTCGLRDTGEIACWGSNGHGQSDAPEGSYTAVSAGGIHTCAIRKGDSAIECWGADTYGQATPPTD